jgi:hypothetical protein
MPATIFSYSSFFSDTGIPVSEIIQNFAHEQNLL